MVHKVVLLVLLVGLAVEAYQLKSLQKHQNGNNDDEALKNAFGKMFDQNTDIDDGVQNTDDDDDDEDEDEEEDESLDLVKQLVAKRMIDADSDDDDDEEEQDEEEQDESLDLAKQLVMNGMIDADVYNGEEHKLDNKLGYEIYQDESMDDDDMEEMDEIATVRKDPLWFRIPRFRFPRFRFPRFRFPRFRFPRFRFPRIRLPRIRFPRIRIPRIRLPRIRLPRIRLPRIRLPRIRLPRIRLPRIRLPRIRFPRIRLPRIRFRLKNLIKPEELFKKLLLKLIRKPKPPQNPCPYSEAQIMSRVNGIRCPAHWKTFFGANARSTANEIVDGENFINYCKPYTLCKACAPSSPWSSSACENKLNNQLQEFCKAISTDDADLLPWCQGIVSKIISYERSQTHSNNADLCKCGAGEAGKPA